MLTAERRRMNLAECLEAGAAGWVGKGASMDEVDCALTHVVDAGTVIGRADRAALLAELQLERAGRLRANATFAQLTHREALVLGALIDGLSAEEIAAAHFVALTTVRSQIRAVLQKVGVRSQLAAVAVASAHRELLPDEARTGRDRRRPYAGRPGGPDFARRSVDVRSPVAVQA
jgi:DNA-binding NarL/FixJ family response regulator